MGLSGPHYVQIHSDLIDWDFTGGYQRISDVQGEVRLMYQHVRVHVPNLRLYRPGCGPTSGFRHGTQLRDWTLTDEALSWFYERAIRPIVVYYYELNEIWSIDWKGNDVPFYFIRRYFWFQDPNHAFEFKMTFC